MIGVTDLFRIGLGPSSSHTVGPMKAAAFFAAALDGRQVARVRCELFGSLAWTGAGHATDTAVILGLAGHRPDTVDPAAISRIVGEIGAGRVLRLGTGTVIFDPAQDIVFDRRTATPVHPNTLRFCAFAADGTLLHEERWCSIGGGFVTREHLVGRPETSEPDARPFPFDTAAALLALCRQHGMTIAQIVRANEPDGDELDGYLDRIIAVMMDTVDRGLAAEGVLPGRLGVRRRAAGIWRSLQADRSCNRPSPHRILDYVSLYAIAVNEENAAGGRIVTAPTNGAAGVIPAVLSYYAHFWPGADRAGMHDLLLTATAVGIITKLNASISGAEVGCQGEVGTASAMAAAGFAAALGATAPQIENAAEIAMEHHLGMTCDPVAGLVQVPCIERNAFGAVKAINAASLALRGDGSHLVSFDQVVETMLATGRDMNDRYRETSEGGLAVRFPEC